MAINNEMTWSHSIIYIIKIQPYYGCIFIMPVEALYHNEFKMINTLSGLTYKKFRKWEIKL